MPVIRSAKSARPAMPPGPHLHFEFARDGEKLDYLSVKIPSAESLSGYKLVQFRREQAKWLSALRGSAVRIVQSANLILAIALTFRIENRAKVSRAAFLGHGCT